LLWFLLVPLSEFSESEAFDAMKSYLELSLPKQEELAAAVAASMAYITFINNNGEHHSSITHVMDIALFLYDTECVCNRINDVLFIFFQIKIVSMSLLLLFPSILVELHQLQIFLGLQLGLQIHLFLLELLLLGILLELLGLQLLLRLQLGLGIQVRHLALLNVQHDFRMQGHHHTLPPMSLKMKFHIT
jgi:hypothetical protein